MARVAFSTLVILLLGASLGRWGFAEEAGGADEKGKAEQPREEKAKAEKAGKKKAGKSSEAPGPSDVAVEAESLTLTGAEVVEDAEASGGKAVRFVQDTAQATGTVNLLKGAYLLDVVMKCPDKDHDTIWVAVGSQEKVKAFPSHARYPQTRFSPARTEGTGVQVAADGPVQLTLSARETGMLIDRLIFRKQ